MRRHACTPGTRHKLDQYPFATTTSSSGMHDKESGINALRMMWENGYLFFSWRVLLHCLTKLGAT
jgi:hypothetical protein